ncbi:MAG: hypothetical protein E5V46_06495 [Mesorhizobium sp.]|nr:MAG: hypothetical protein E5V46_06495 [Mesorhizobium sp.]
MTAVISAGTCGQPLLAMMSLAQKKATSRQKPPIIVSLIFETVMREPPAVRFPAGKAARTG